MRVLTAAHVLAIVAAIALGSALGASDVAAPAGPFTLAQADAGRAAYRRYCERCHGHELAGDRDVPPIAGPTFIDRWRRRTVLELFQYIQRTMPPESSGDAGYQVDLSIVAFVLQANGAQPGKAALTLTTDVAIGALADGHMPPAVRAALRK